MKRPAFQFYPADWRNNAKLRRCTFHERGVWIEVMGLLHDSDHYGMLHWPAKEIARAIGCRVSDLIALHERDVMKGLEAGPFAGFEYRPRHGRQEGSPVDLILPCAGPIYFSSRMVIDEYIRLHAGSKTRFGSPSRDVPSAPARRQGERQGAVPSRRRGDGSSSTSSSTSKNLKPKAGAPPAADAPPGVQQEVWAAWLKRKGKDQTEEADRLQRKHLAEWVADGQDANAIVERAVAARHQGLNPIERRSVNGHSNSTVGERRGNSLGLIGKEGNGRVINGAAERVDQSSVSALPLDLRQQGRRDVRLDGDGPEGGRAADGRPDGDVGSGTRKV